MARLHGLFLCPVLISLLATFGQNASSPQTAEPGGATTKAQSSPVLSPQITLEVVVTDRFGTPIRGLRKRDFTLLDKREPQEISLFHPVDRSLPAPGDPAMEIILVVDAINASEQTIAIEQKWLKKFFLQSDGKLAQPFSIIFFSGAGKIQLSPASRDAKALAELCERTLLGPPTDNLSGPTSHVAFERFNLSIKTLASLADYQIKRPGRKLMIWLSPGWPLLSGPNLELSGKDYQFLFDSTVRISTVLQQAHITLYNVDPLGISNTGGTRIVYYRDFLKGVVSPSHAEPAYLGLPVIATQTGGRVLNASNDLAAEIEECLADGSYYYIVAFKAPVSAQAIEYHPIEVITSSPGAIVRTRLGYYSQP